MPDFDWKWLISVIVPGGVTLYHFVIKDILRKRKETKKTRDRFSARVAQALHELLFRISESRSLEVYTAEVQEAPTFEPEFTYSDLLTGKQVENSLIRQEISSRLRNIYDLTSQYRSWRDELLFITKAVLSKELERRGELRAKWDILVKHAGMRLLESEIEELVSPPLLKGALNLDEVKGAFIDKFGPDWVGEVPATRIQVGMGIFPQEKEPEKEQIKLREHILDTRDFHLLIGKLGDVAKRPSFMEFARTRHELCQQVKDTLIIISKVGPQSSQVVQSFLPLSK